MKVIRKLISYTGPGLALQELLYGFVMALIFVAAAQIGIVQFESNRDLIVAILGMNTAWGIIDMIVFTLVDRFDQRKYIRIVSMNKERYVDEKELKEIIRDNLSGTLIDVLDYEDEKKIVRQILNAGLDTEENLKNERMDIFKGNFVCFLLTILTCIPVITPLLIIPDLHLACLWSSSVSAVFLFFIGYFMHPYTGINKWIMGFMISGIGIGITAMALLLGG